MVCALFTSYLLPKTSYLLHEICAQVPSALSCQAWESPGSAATRPGWTSPWPIFAAMAAPKNSFFHHLE